MLINNSYQSPLGKIILLSNDKYLLGLWFSDQKYFGAKYNLAASHVGDSHPISEAKKWLTDYFAGRKPSISNIPLSPEVTDFRQSVLKVLIKVPYGSTITYKQIADKIPAEHSTGHTAARAVGGAVGHNPISLIIPCHRVVGSDGSLTGYAGGIDRKIQLLKLEGINLTQLHG